MNHVKIEGEEKTCRGCGECKPISEYRKNPSGKSHRNFCRSCDRIKAGKVSEAQKREAAKRREKAIEDGEMDRCSHCGDHFPIAQFKVDNSKKSGYTRVCRRCSYKSSVKNKSEKLKEKEKIAFSLREAGVRKVCRKCGKEKSLYEYTIHIDYSDAHNSTCKRCVSEVSLERYYKNKESELEAKKRRRDEKRKWLWEYLKSHPCVDCGNDDPRVLELDHLGDKIDSVSRLVSQGNSLNSVIEEVKKCEVRCANCHAIVTAERGGFWRFELWRGEQDGN